MTTKNDALDQIIDELAGISALVFVLVDHLGLDQDKLARRIRRHMPRHRELQRSIIGPRLRAAAAVQRERAAGCSGGPAG